MKTLSAYWMILGLAGLAACSHTPMQFYMLNAETGLSADGVGAPLPIGTTLGLGPIHLPAYLDRPQLVTALSEHQYALDDNQRWAERLDENVSRALVQSLSRQLGLGQVLRYPWPQKQIPDYQVSADILELHQTASAQSQLILQWQLKKSDQPILNKRFECHEAAQNQAEAIVAAQSRCLSRFSQEISEQIRHAAR